MDQQGYFRPYRDGAKWRLGRDDAAEKDRHPGFEEGRPDRLLLPLPSEHEGYPRSRAMRPLERSEMGQTEKNSVRAYVFRFALELGHCSIQAALRICARLGHQATSLDHQVGAAEQ